MGYECKHRLYNDREMILRDWMLKENRGFVIAKKLIFETAIIAYALIIPDFTHENVTRPNSHILVDARDEFFEHYDNPHKLKLLKAAWKILISECEHDNHYQWLFEWLVEYLVNHDFKPRPAGHPIKHWKEPEPYGGGYLIKDETLKKYARRFKNLGG